MRLQNWFIRCSHHQSALVALGRINLHASQGRPFPVLAVKGVTTIRATASDRLDLCFEPRLLGIVWRLIRLGESGRGVAVASEIHGPGMYGIRRARLPVQSSRQGDSVNISISESYCGLLPDCWAEYSLRSRSCTELHACNRPREPAGSGSGECRASTLFITSPALDVTLVDCIRGRLWPKRRLS
jgi:hypothetical protein